jgi:hypothetical protein
VDLGKSGLLVRQSSGTGCLVKEKSCNPSPFIDEKPSMSRVQGIALCVKDAHPGWVRVEGGRLHSCQKA